MAKKNLYFIFSSFIHIFRRHLVFTILLKLLPCRSRETPILSQSRKVQEKTAKNKLFLVEKKQEQGEKLWDVHSLKESLSVRPTQCGLLYKQGSPASTNMPIFLFDLWNFGGKNTTNHHEMTVSDCWHHDRWTWDSQIFNTEVGSQKRKHCKREQNLYRVKHFNCMIFEDRSVT